MDFNGLFERASGNARGTLKVKRLDGNMVTVTHADVIRDAEALAQGLQDRGVERGHLVGLQLPNCYEFILWDLAAIRIGAVLQVFPEEVDLKTADPSFAADRFALFMHANLSFESLGPVAPDADIIDDRDILTRAYSSGSSGYLKGLSISRRGTELLISDFIDAFGMSEADSHLLFLPLSNYQQRLSVYACLFAGMSLSVTDFPQLFAALRTDKPSFIIGPPAIFENVFNAFKADPNAAASVQRFLGGNMRFMITGMAPIRTEVLEAFNTRFAQTLLEAYGVTETGMIAWNTFDARRPGTVGKPIHPEHVHLMEDGEIVIKRPSPLSNGYFYSRQGEGHQVFKTDGSIHTGDIGELDAEGFLTLKGRKKEIIVTNAGVKVHPEQIESQLGAIPGVLQVAVLWSPGRKQLAAVIVVDGASEGARRSVATALQEYNERAVSYRKIGAHVITDAKFSMDSGLLTRNLKYHRENIYRHYADAIER
ncbi:AMP-binding protein [Steroidobacter sp. S1-65]|uniref:AMP-binding protein n=1 Tax=Steroidobacter gossypii TaxID=2805490 RepID=A0ABS1X012_9GAMM|nr:AMP-binding protein [Steroidobacter gossypii]MBM0106548.1 AMP-binding protein [Steroidobacter gossypii]